MAKLNLNSKTVGSLKPGAERMDYFDAGKGCVPGFHVRVTPSGEKTFSVLYRYYGRLRRLTIGGMEHWSLADARERAREALRDAAKGIDPAQQKIIERTADTFAELAEAYIAKYASKKRSGREDKRILEKYLIPKLRHVRAKDVKRAEISLILDDIAKDAPIMANRVLATVRKMYNWGISKSLVESNPCTRIEAPGKEHRRDRVLSEEEIKAVWKAFDSSASTVADVYKLRLLTAQRGGEVLSMKWSETDLKERWWTIPAERSKNGLPHRVWLSDLVMRILERAKARNAARTKRSGGPSPWVFPGKRKGKHLTETKRVLESIRTGSRAKDWVGHDLRRTAASHMTSMGIPRLVVARILNHAEQGVTAVYDRHSYDGEKKDALERWASKVMTIVSDLKAVPKNAGPKVSGN